MGEGKHEQLTDNLLLSIEFSLRPCTARDKVLATERQASSTQFLGNV